jgi:hypothetical protein
MDSSLTTKQIEAHLNEYKGNILEFLLAQKFAAAYGLEAVFLENLEDEYLKTLSNYEKEIRKLDESLLIKLPEIAQQAYIFIQHFYSDVLAIKLVGKQQGSGKDKQWKEADILIDQTDCLRGLSLKLCKRGAFVNSKSGGIRSFLTKYFCSFSQSNELEQQINTLIDQGFLQMIHRLYSHAGLDFKGRYDQQWVEAGYSELPGELCDEHRQIVHHFYFELAQKLYRCFVELERVDKKKFLHAVIQLLGHSGSSVDHLYIFHHKGHQWDHALYIYSNDFSQLSDYAMGKVEKGQSYFYLYFQQFTLQVRLKPMNKFTSAALKVNCSIKFI